jgi:adenosine/AMP kinase
MAVKQTGSARIKTGGIDSRHPPFYRGPCAETIQSIALITASHQADCRRKVDCRPRSILIIQMELKTVRLEIPQDGNIILGQSHFIKTVEDVYEALVNTVPQMKFGIAFNEASGACLTRIDGNDEDLKSLAGRNASAVRAGHTFVVAMRNGFPSNVLNRIKDVPEVCSIFCATANPVEVVVAETELGRGVLGVIDGAPPKGTETESDVAVRYDFLRKVGYKR